VARLREIVFDCLDAPALARFWAAALDGYAIRAYDAAEVARLAAIGFTPETDPNVAVDGPGPTLFMQQMPELSPARSRVHIDIEASDREAEVARLLQLGATLRERDEDHSVLLDPAGNTFCVVGARQRSG